MQKFQEFDYNISYFIVVYFACHSASKHLPGVLLIEINIKYYIFNRLVKEKNTYI